MGAVGGIAPFDYGAQSAGDAFHLFIRKGDPFPTQNPQAQIFRTRVPRQRMVSIPIFGGDARERASANQKQGEAFAVAAQPAVGVFAGFRRRGKAPAEPGEKCGDGSGKAHAPGV